SAIVLHSYLLMVRLPLKSTLFPYTTLFRSVRFRTRRSPQRFPSWRDSASRPLRGGSSVPSLGSPLPVRAAQILDSSLLKRTLGKDRKSTRLNSSHVKISYAVFCLKKKKKKK